MSANQIGWNSTTELSKLPKISATVIAGFLVLVVMLALAALAPVAARADACPNATERFGSSANLPDCRAYELVTPAIKGDNSLITEIYGFSDGEHVTMTSILPFPGAVAGEPQPVLSSRTPSGWVSTPLAPRQGPGELDNLYSEDTGNIPLRVSFTSDFSAAFVDSPFASDPLDQNSVYDVYRVAIPSGASSLASFPDSGETSEESSGSFIAGNSSDGSHVFFATLGRLSTAPGTPADTHAAGVETYERYAGHTYLVGVLPDGSVAPCGAEVGNGGDTLNEYYSQMKYGAVSPDGSNVVFHTDATGTGASSECPENFLANPQLGGLYLREGDGTPDANTVKLPGQFFLVRAAAGSKIISTGGPGATEEGEPLYEYDVATGQTTTIGYGSLVAYSADGSQVYYITETQELKVYDDGTTKTIPNAGGGYSGGRYRGGRANEPGIKDLGVSTPDGSKLLFLDSANLTGYNSEGHSEAYVYDLDSGSISCASCNPNGLPPVADVKLLDPPTFNPWVSQAAPLISEDGSRVFFETKEALVPQDTNGQPDIYEWEDGHIYLLSSGTGGTPGAGGENGFNNENLGVEGSILVGASSNGDDVFIATDDKLLPQDVESSLEVYDIRVDGGFPYTTPVYGCDSGQCQGPQTPAPLFSPPASATFVGLGNPVREEAGAAVKPKPREKPKSKPKAKTKRPKHRTKGARRRGAKASHKGKGRK